MFASWQFGEVDGVTRDASDLFTKRSFTFVPLQGTLSYRDLQSIYMHTYISLLYEN